MPPPPPPPKLAKKGPPPGKASPGPPGKASPGPGSKAPPVPGKKAPPVPGKASPMAGKASPGPVGAKKAPPAPGAKAPPGKASPAAGKAPPPGMKAPPGKASPVAGKAPPPGAVAPGKVKGPPPSVGKSPGPKAAASPTKAPPKTPGSPKAPPTGTKAPPPGSKTPTSPAGPKKLPAKAPTSPVAGTPAKKAAPPAVKAPPKLPLPLSGSGSTGSTPTQPNPPAPDTPRSEASSIQGGRDQEFSPGPTPRDMAGAEGGAKIPLGTPMVTPRRPVASEQRSVTSPSPPPPSEPPSESMQDSPRSAPPVQQPVSVTTPPAVVTRSRPPLPPDGDPFAAVTANEAPAQSPSPPPPARSESPGPRASSLRPALEALSVLPPEYFRGASLAEAQRTEYERTVEHLQAQLAQAQARFDMLAGETQRLRESLMDRDGAKTVLHAAELERENQSLNMQIQKEKDSVRYHHQAHLAALDELATLRHKVARDGDYDSMVADQQRLRDRNDELVRRNTELSLQIADLEEASAANNVSFNVTDPLTPSPALRGVSGGPSMPAFVRVRRSALCTTCLDSVNRFESALLKRTTGNLESLYPSYVDPGVISNREDSTGARGWRPLQLQDGRTVYHNVLTSESSWNPPTGR